jgi:transcriptional antiterminator NusG
VNDESDNATDQALDPSAPVPPAGPANGAAAETAASPEGATVEAAAPASNVSAAGTVPTILAPSPPVRIPPVRRSAGENAPPPNPEERHWFILKVQSNREESIKDALQRRVAIEGLEAYFGDVIVPVEMVSEFKNGKKRIVKRKLYPGYIVVHMEINDETWHLDPEKEGREDRGPAQGRNPLQPGRPRKDQGGHLRELRGERRDDRYGQRPCDGDDQHFRPLDARRARLLGNRRYLTASSWVFGLRS